MFLNLKKCILCIKTVNSKQKLATTFSAFSFSVCSGTATHSMSSHVAWKNFANVTQLLLARIQSISEPMWYAWNHLSTLTVLPGTHYVVGPVEVVLLFPLQGSHDIPGSEIYTSTIWQCSCPMQTKRMEVCKEAREIPGTVFWLSSWESVVWMVREAKMIVQTQEWQKAPACRKHHFLAMINFSTYLNYYFSKNKSSNNV